MATTATRIVPDRTNKDHRPKRKPMSKAHRAKLVAALANWRASLTDEERAELAERNRQQHKAKWEAMSKKERDARLAGVRAWQAEQRDAKAKAGPKAGHRKAPEKPSSHAEVNERPVRKRTVKPLAESTRPLEADLQFEVVEEPPKGTRKVVAK